MSRFIVFDAPGENSSHKGLTIRSRKDFAMTFDLFSHNGEGCFWNGWIPKFSKRFNER